MVVRTPLAAAYPYAQLGHSVVNLSNLHLTKPQMEALEKGLTFCPTPYDPDIVDIWNDLEEFFRCLKIKCYFAEVITDPENEQPNPLKK